VKDGTINDRSKVLLIYSKMKLHNLCITLMCLKGLVGLVVIFHVQQEASCYWLVAHWKWVALVCVFVCV